MHRLMLYSNYYVYLVLNPLLRAQVHRTLRALQTNFLVK
jgi:hypothetical protein